MDYLFWIAVVAGGVLLSTVALHMWVYSATRAYYRGMFDAYRDGVRRMGGAPTQSQGDNGSNLH